MTEPDEQTTQLAFDALRAAERVLMASGRQVDGVVVLIEIDGQGITIAVNDSVNLDHLSTVLAEASWRAAGAGA